MSILGEDRPPRWLPKGPVPENDEVPDQAFSDLKAERQLHLNFDGANLRETMQLIHETLSVDPHAPSRVDPHAPVPENDEVSDEEFSRLKEEAQLRLHFNVDTTKLREALSQLGEIPSRVDPHAPGAKLDHGKVRPGLVLSGFCRALEAVSEVGTFGARKYSEKGWLHVENGVSRYTDAMLRHYFEEAKGEYADPESGIAHAAHLAWNALARLELMLRQAEECGEFDT